eukprot:3377266-Pyramimonas_sp.AAC.2
MAVPIADDVQKFSSSRSFSTHARSLKSTGVNPRYHQQHKRGSGIGCHYKEEKCYVFYNRVTHSGSVALVYIMDALKDKNHFHAVHSGGSNKKILSPNAQRILGNYVKHQPCGTMINRPVHFVEFEHLGQKPPLWINLIRNPIDKLVSRFYHEYPRFDKEEVPRLFDKCVRKAMSEAPTSAASEACLRPTIQMAYFCGQHPDCFIDPSMIFDEATRTQLLIKMRKMAEYNVQYRYLAVGVLDKLLKFLRMMEVMLPAYFKGAGEAWKHYREPVPHRYPHPTNATIALLEDYYEQEMLFYNFVYTQFLSKADACGVMDMPKEVKRGNSAMKPTLSYHQ